jgi:2-polyprenyl-6-methoxyphenol hydroxylase-like FAD-dependent oxidoreductase
MAGADALAGRRGMAEVPDGRVDVHRGRHEREDRALSDCARFDAGRFNVPGVDVEALVRSTSVCWEYPMCDRDPLPHWSYGRVTLLGDAAHPMYPVGSNGAAQAILDARSLADWLRKADHPMQALHEYERDRLPKTAEIVRLNRKGGPERVIDEVEKLAPAGFESVERVLSHSEREAIVKGYANTAGFTQSQVNK